MSELTRCREWKGDFRKALTEDVEGMATHLRKAMDIARDLSVDLKGFNGTPGFFRQKGNEIELMIAAAEEERDRVLAKFLGDEGIEIVQSVDEAKAAEVVAARKSA